MIKLLFYLASKIRIKFMQLGCKNTICTFKCIYYAKYVYIL